MATKIVTYRELEWKDGLLPLLDQAFNWVFDERKFEESVKMDPRLKNGPVGFCAVEKDRLVGYVGVMSIPTRTLSGKVERVGGIYGVATLPGYTRRGISTELMEDAHRYLRDTGHPFSFLATSPTIIAHGFYEKLGYTDIIEYPSAYKVVKSTKTGPLKRQKTRTLDVDKILRIYTEFVKGKTGFAIRDKTYFKAIAKIEGIKAKQCIVRESGYAIFREDKSGVWIRELVGLSEGEMGSLARLLEGRAKRVIYDRAVLNVQLLKVYKSRGYMIEDRSHGVLMVKPLIPDVSFTQTYGDRFYLSRLDLF